MTKITSVSAVFDMNRGFFITFEGPDGCGKSTQIRKLAEYCESLGYTVKLTREPGGSAISEKIRQILLDPENREMCGVAEALLYAAARAQHVEQTIRPAVEAGQIVLCDRFMDSSIAYQAYGRGLGDDVRIINEFAVQGMQPDLTFFLDIDPAKGLARAASHSKPDRLEQEKLEFHQRVHDGYLALKEIYSSRYVCIDAEQSIEDIAQIIDASFDRYVAERA